MSKSAQAQATADWNDYVEKAKTFGTGAIGALQNLHDLITPYNAAVATVGNDPDDVAAIDTRQDAMIAACKTETDKWSPEDRALFKALFQQVIDNALGQAMGETLGLTVATSSATTVTSSASTNTKGSWTTLGTAGSDFVAIEFVIAGVGFNNGSYLVDFDVDSTIYAENVYVKARSAYNSATRRIIVYRGGSSGDDVRARCQTANGSSRDVYVYARTITASELLLDTGSVSDSYGGNTAASEGTELDPGGTANTEVITEIASSLSNSINHLSINLDTEDNTLTTERWTAQLYTGGSGSEVARGAPWLINSMSSQDNVSLPVCNMFVDPAHFGSGTRLSIGLRCTTTDATNRLIYATVHASLVSAQGSGGASGPTRYKRLRYI